MYLSIGSIESPEEKLVLELSIFFYPQVYALGACLYKVPKNA
jgi:hypothetical protein